MPLKATLFWLIVLLSPSASANPKALGEAYRALAAGDAPKALRASKKVNRASYINEDYAVYVVAQSHFIGEKYGSAKKHFSKLASMSSRFRDVAKWRVADCEWLMGQRKAAANRYARLLRGKNDSDIDRALAYFRIAQTTDGSTKERKLKQFLRDFPLHPLETQVLAELQRLEPKFSFSPRERLQRAKELRDDHKWHEAIAELAKIPDKVPQDFKHNVMFHKGMTFFKMRRRYGDAAKILLDVYPYAGSDADYAFFHGARALSRVHKDKEAIVQYQKVVAAYPRSRWAKEAQYLSGWLEFNLGDYKLAIPHFERMLKMYPRSKWIPQTRWFLGMSYYFMDKCDKALPIFQRIRKRGGKWKGGKGHYWAARCQQKMGKKDAAIASYRELVGRFPFSWYALLAQERLLVDYKVKISPFGDSPLSTNVTKIDGEVDTSLANDKVIRQADELEKAGLPLFAAQELRQGERQLIRRHGKGKALGFLMDRYSQAGNYNRPWMLSIIYGGWRALNAPPQGNARAWWVHAYPLAYKDLIDKHRALGGSPDYFLYSIMRKESGFNPHVRSYAEALGLLQMIPPTTKRVVKELGMEYSPDVLYDPETNIKTASWYIGRLLAKFRGQIPLGAGSFNSGPKPVMRWCRENGKHPMDEFVELVSYRQTRLYMKKVTETYARYKYLYDGEVYRQPLKVKANYIKNKLTY